MHVSLTVHLYMHVTHACCWGIEGMRVLSRAASGQKSRVQLDFSDGMHMTENSDRPQSARMRAQIQANTGNFAAQRFSLHGVDLTKFDGGGGRDQEVRFLRPPCMHSGN